MSRGDDARADHARRAAELRVRALGFERRGNAVSLARLVLFLGAVVLIGAGIGNASQVMMAAGGALGVLFIVAIIVHAAVLDRRDRAEVRAQVHERHVQRLGKEWQKLPAPDAKLLGAAHPYAGDIDLVGPGSLLQRIDTTHTTRGAARLAAWLGAPADAETIRARQEAVKELAGNVQLREELEASARVAGEAKLDAGPFLAFADHPSFFAQYPFLAVVVRVTPFASVSLIGLDLLDVVPGYAWAPVVLAHIGLNLWTGPKVSRAFDLVAARRKFGEAFEGMMRVVEDAKFESAHLVALRERMRIGGLRASDQMKRLDRWLGLADLRSQFLLHVWMNQIFLWDLNCLLGLERWNRDVNKHASQWFDVLGELEALSSLSVLLHGDGQFTLPEIAEDGSPLVAEGLGHPLLVEGQRVLNDVALDGPGSALLVTGSNMAGKSTLLRSVGLNAALALAGGPVCAGGMSLPLLTLRASMRAEDDLMAGASYFRAELLKLRAVVEDVAPGRPPILFLLDELLRGTNAHARHLGARAIVLHLLRRGATGLIATHDVALANLEETEKVKNAHFTDVVTAGEMTFDYVLRPGVVRTSNALRLLKLAGIDVPDDDAVSD